MPQGRTSHSGFSLVELSIVLAVVGLLTGGVLVGQNLVQRTKLIGLMGELGKYKTAYTKFKEIYQALPGDMLDATEQWGADPSGCPDNTNRVPHKETCNGGGDGYIGFDNAYLLASLQTNGEYIRAWQHLSNAGLVEGTYTGVSGPGGNGDVEGKANSPEGPFKGGAYTLWSLGNWPAGNVDWPGATYGTFIIYGKMIPGTRPHNPILTPRQQYNIDLKIDDGQPNTGSLLSFKPTTSYHVGCAASATAYNLANTAPACGINYIIDAY